MLTSIPNDLQSHILSYLPRKDVAAVARVSQHLHAVAIRVLYVKVELRSSVHLCDFLYPPDSLLETYWDGSWDGRKPYWYFIEELTIDIRYDDAAGQEAIPTSLRNGNSIELERLRVVYPRDPSPLLPLLRSLNPEHLVLSNTSFYAGGLLSLTGLGGSWTRLREVTFQSVVGSRGGVTKYVPFGSSPFLEVTSVNLALSFYAYPPPGADEGGSTISLVLRLCPSLRRLHVVVAAEEESTRLKTLVKGGFGGKGEEVFMVEVGDPERYGIDG